MLPLLFKFCLLGVGLFIPSIAAGDAPRHEKDVLAAWQALEGQKNADAVSFAEKVIDEFGPTARRKQAELADKANTLPVGRVTDEQKREVISNGVLNDVAAAYWVRGVAAHRLRMPGLARESFSEAAKLTAARVWDLQGFFWQPSEIAGLCVDQPEFSSAFPNEVLVGLAWKAFNAAKYKDAIAYADKVVLQFGKMAARQHAELVTARRDFPTGAVTERQKLEVFRNGLVNDVATAHFIRGKSFEATGDRANAISAYQEAMRLPLGRCWDPNGWFWSPAEGSGDRISLLRFQR